ncbi:MAG: Kynurenine formamidase [Chloroflexi bacterium]|nr:Kynurenine formamidase [Chloroflexota bacterium]
MPIYDISLPITPNLPTWPGEDKVQLTQTSSIKEGDLANVTHVSMGVHTGTHIDAPDHFLGNGVGVDQIPLDLLIGPVTVLHFPACEIITADMLRAAEIPTQAKRLLFKTRNSKYWAEGEIEFQGDFVALNPDAAQYLVQRGVEVVGVDYLSVAPFDDPVPTHKILLQANVLVIEGLDLSEVPPGDYALYCLPLKIAGADGAPARAVLIG